MKNIIIRLLLVLIFTVVLSGAAEANAFSPITALKYSQFEFEFQSNFFGLDTFYNYALKKIETEILGDKKLPNQLLNRNLWDLQLPFKVKDNAIYGIYAGGSGWSAVTGDIAKFYRDFDKENPPGNGRIYNLGVDYQSYSTVGLYQKMTSNNSTTFTVDVTSKLFAVFDYQKFEAIGTGLLKKTDTDTVQGELHATYHKTRLVDGLGFGFGLDWETKLELNPQTELKLKVKNLPGVAYFSDLQTENGRGDAIQETKDPIVVNGYKVSTNEWIRLPLVAYVNLNYETSIGDIGLSAYSIGEVQDFSIDFKRQFTQQIDGLFSYNPVMKKVGVGCEWAKGKFMISFSSLDEPICGLLFQVKIN